MTYLEQVQRGIDYIECHLEYELSVDAVAREAGIRVGMKIGFYGVDSEKNNIANRLPPLWQSFLQRLNEVETAIGGTCYGVIQQTAADSERLDYYAAVAVSTSNKLPDGMVRVDIPESRYAFFEHRGEVRLIDSTVNYIYSGWLLNSGHRHTYGPDLEVYGADYHPVSAKSVMGYAIPIG